MVPARRAAHDAARLAPRRRARARRLPERRGDPDARRRRASRSSTTRSSCSSTRTTSRSSSCSRRGASAHAVAVRALDGGAGRADGSRSYTARAAVPVESRSIARAPPRLVKLRARPTGCSCGRGSASARRARSCRTCASSAISHLYLSPSCRRGRARRTATTSSTRRGSRSELGGEDGVPRRSAAAGLGVMLDVVPNHMAASDENPFWGDPELRATVLRLRPGERLVPALLRHRRAGRRARRGSRGLRDRRTRRCSSSCATGSSTGCASTIPTGSPTRAATSSGSRRGRRARLGREDPRAGRAPARLAGRGHDRLRVRERRDGALRRPARRGAAHALYEELTGETRGRSTRSRTRRSSSWRGRPSSAEVERLRAAACDDGRASQRPRSRRCTSTARTSSRRRVASRTPTARRSQRCPEDLRRILLLEERGHDEFVTRFQQTTGPGHGEGRRGHGVLPLLPADGAERGRRRPGPLLAARRRVPPREPRARGALPATICSRRRRTTRSARGDVRARIVALAGLADEWAERARGVARDSTTRTRTTSLWQTLVGAWPIEPERLEALPARRRFARRR